MPVLILLAGLFLAPSAVLAGEAGCVYEYAGTVEIFKSGGDSWRQVSKGLPLSEGDKVKTGEKDWCEILFKDGTFVKLEAGSETLVEELKIAPDSRAYSFNLLRGKTLWMAAKLKAAFKSKFSVRTPSAVCAVRGTDFSIMVSTAGETTFGLFEGKIALSAPAGQEKELLAGNEASADAAGLTVQAGLSRAMQAEKRRYEKLKSRVENLRKRLAERDNFIDDYINRQKKKLTDFETRRAEKLNKR